MNHIATGDILIHGVGGGADIMAERWYTFFVGGGNQYFNIEEYVRRFPASWLRYDKAAGPIRNKQMLDEGKPDLVIAFPGGKGTANMVKLAKEAGVEVIEIENV